MINFQVRLSCLDNPDKVKFLIVEECKDMDDCLDHIWATEKGWVVDSIKRL